MTANELRIGNHIKFECDTLHMTTFGIITGIEQHFQYKDGRRITKSIYGASLIDQWGNERQADVVDIEPIPLTPEILEKAGFEFHFGGQAPDYIEFKNLELFWYEEKLSACFQKDFDVEITYLHQLQNLYFALTGEELNIQL